MADTPFYDLNNDPIAPGDTGPVVRGKWNGVLPKAQSEFELRDSWLTGVFPAYTPVLAISGAHVTCSNLNALVAGLRITAAGYWDLTGKGDGTWNLELDGSCTYHVNASPNAAMLHMATVVMTGGSLSALTPAFTYLSLGSVISSVFGRTGIVIAALHDYAASLIDNDSGVTGSTVKDCLIYLKGLIDAIETGAISTVFGRTGAVVATLNDYAASLVSNDSSVTGATVKAALNTLAGQITTLGSGFNWQPETQDVNLNTPPGSPVTNGVYGSGSAPTDAWLNGAYWFWTWSG